MLKKIEWFEEDGCLGGYRGLSFNVVKNTITKQNGDKEPLSRKNLKDVLYCIENNIDYLKNRVIEIQLKLRQKETKTTRIDNGYKVSYPLNETQIGKSKIKIDDLLKQIEEYEDLLTKISNKKLN